MLLTNFQPQCRQADCYQPFLSGFGQNQVYWFNPRTSLDIKSMYLVGGGNAYLYQVLEGGYSAISLVTTEFSHKPLVFSCLFKLNSSNFCAFCNLAGVRTYYFAPAHSPSFAAFVATSLVSLVFSQASVAFSFASPICSLFGLSLPQAELLDSSLPHVSIERHAYMHFVALSLLTSKGLAVLLFSLPVLLSVAFTIAFFKAQPPPLGNHDF